MSFAQLHAKTVAIAGRLRASAVGPGDRVMILGQKTVSTVAALFGVARCGATYVPVDPSAPVERLRFLFEDLAPAAVVCDLPNLSAELRSVLASVPLLRTPLDDNEAPLSESIGGVEPRWSNNSACGPESVAYILYTSGSTGRPKGVQIQHRSIKAFFDAHNERVHIRAGDRCLNSGPFHFDVSILDVLLPLACGAYVRLSPELPLPSVMLSLLEVERITHFYAVGTVLGLITGDGSAMGQYRLETLRVLQTGAEVCNPKVVNHWLRQVPHLEFLNSYGPTEATVGCVSYLKPRPGLLPESEVPIGMPHTGTEIALRCPQTECLINEPNTTGELLLTGAQVMLGYLHRPREERRAFCEIAGRRYYRTGDLAYRDSAGLLYFVGRIDEELKISGCRIHPNEIALALRGCEGVADACVGTESTEFGGRRILAAIVALTGQDRSEVRARISLQLQKTLPRHMHPSRLIFKQELPRLPSGKCDYRRVFCTQGEDT